MSRARFSVLFLTLYPETTASPRYRVTQFVPYLEQHGVDCTVACALSADEYARLTDPTHSKRGFWYHLAETPRRLRQILYGRRYDIVFVQKALMTAYVRGFERLLARCAKRIIYDLDDAMHLMPPHKLGFPWRLLEDGNQIGKLMARADHVIAGNAWLADEARRFGSDVSVLPTVVDTERFVPASIPPDTYRIGWIGYPRTMICLDECSEALARFRDGELCFVGGESARAPWPCAVVRPWSLDTEVAETQRFSAGIMPLPKVPWMKGKCASKALLYMACGVPCVATPFGAALELIQDDENGLFADTTDEWCHAFDRLREPALRHRLGDAARTTIEEQYSLKTAAPKLLEILESVV